MVPRSDKNGSSRPVPTKGGFEPGDAGIWATCDMKKEARSVVELRDLFEEVSEL
jgi:tRNA acetyltransferase TAN1